MTAGVPSVVTASLGMVPTESAMAGVLQLEASSSSGGEEGETSAIWVAKQESALTACLTSWEAPDLKGTGGTCSPRRLLEGCRPAVCGQSNDGDCTFGRGYKFLHSCEICRGHLKHRCPSMLGPGRSRSYARGMRQGELGHGGVYCISILNEKLVVSCVLITA